MTTPIQPPKPGADTHQQLVRRCPFLEYDLALGDVVVWKGHDHEGLWMVNSMHYVLDDGRKAASIVLDADIQSNRKHRRSEIVPLDDLACVIGVNEANTKRLRTDDPPRGGSTQDALVGGDS